MGAGEGTDILPTHGVMGGYIESCGSYSVASDGPSPRVTDGSASLAPYTEGGSGLERTYEYVREGTVERPRVWVGDVSSPAAAVFSTSTSLVGVAVNPLDDDMGDGV